MDSHLKSKISHSTIILSDTLDDSGIVSEINKIPCEHFEYSQMENAIIYKNFYSNKNCNISNVNRIKRFNDLKDNDEIKHFHVDAKFHSFLFTDPIYLFESTSSLRKYATIIQCNSNDCDYQDNFEEFLEDNKLYKEIDGKLVKLKSESPEIIDNTNIERLQCPKCKTLNCILCLDFTFILQDYDDILLIARCTGDDANLFFSCSTSDLCSNKTEHLKTIATMLKFMYHITNDPTECLEKITWTLATSGEKDQRQYRMIKASILTKSLACGAML